MSLFWFRLLACRYTRFSVARSLLGCMAPAVMYMEARMPADPYIIRMYMSLPCGMCMWLCGKECYMTLNMYARKWARHRICQIRDARGADMVLGDS